MRLRWIFVSYLILSLSGCATNMYGPKVQSLNRPLTEIRAIAYSQLPRGQRSLSENGRELISNYFILGPNNQYKDAEKARDRYYAQFTILGDERPYDVAVMVIHERRQGSTYVNVGIDAGLTHRLLDKLHVELTKRREDRNIIDDFRVY